MVKPKRLKDGANEPLTADELVELLEDVAVRMDSAADVIQSNCTANKEEPKEDKPVKIVLDEETQNALVSSCGIAAKNKVKEVLEQRHEEQLKEKEKAEKYNREHGFNTVEEVVNNHANDYNKLVNVFDKDTENRRKYLKKVRSWEINNVHVFMRWGDRKYAELVSLIDKARGGSGVLKPEPPKKGDFFDMQRFYFIQMPAYWLKVFFFDPHTKNYFRILIACCWMMTLGLNYFMARDMAELELDKEKLQIIRLWSYVDDGTDAVSRVRHLDALFADEKNNRAEINDLIVRIKEARRKAETARRK